MARRKGIERVKKITFRDSRQGMKPICRSLGTQDRERVAKLRRQLHLVPRNPFTLALRPASDREDP